MIFAQNLQNQINKPQGQSNKKPAQEEESEYESETDSENEFKCQFCGDYYKDEKDLQKHTDYYCASRPVECPQCNKMLDKDFMESHLLACGTDKVICSICGAVMCKDELADHAIAHNLDQREI